MAIELYLVLTVVLLALTFQVQVTQSTIKNSETKESTNHQNHSRNCHSACGLNNVTLTMVENGLQLVDPSTYGMFSQKVDLKLY